MEAVCPHLGAPLSHAPIEDMEDTKTIGELLVMNETDVKSVHGIRYVFRL
jgi:hypothetical protein